MNKKVRKAIIPAAGLGTRFLPATKAIAKDPIYHSRSSRQWNRRNLNYYKQ